MKYNFEIRKTSFITDKDDERQSLNLQLIDSTTLPTNPMNRYNCIDGNNLIYISGNYIVYYNFFQNTKIFASKVSSYDPIALTLNVYGDGQLAIASQSKSKKQLTIELYTFSQVYVPTHTITEEIQFIDFAFCADTVLVVVGRGTDGKCWAYVMGSKSLEMEMLGFEVRKVVRSERKVHFIADYGVVDFDFQKINIGFDEENNKIVRFSDYQIDDYVEVQSQTVVFLHDNTLECHWQDTQHIDIVPLEPLFPETPISTKKLVKVGRNILIAHETSFTLSHFTIEQQSIKFQNNYSYSQKIKAGILCMQDSLDEMHVSLGVEIYERQDTKIENFMFNLSVFSNSKKYISPFIRLVSNGIESGTFVSFENVLSSHTYSLIGQRITTLQYKNSLDKVTVYNLYETPKFFAIHPLGYQFLCGYDNIIKFYNKKGYDMEEIWNEHYICTCAKYSTSGTLVLACIEDNYTVLVNYNPYTFQKMHNIPITYLKVIITRMEFVDRGTSLVLFGSAEFLKVNIVTGEKISDFRERKDSGISVGCVQYDVERDVVIAGVLGGKGIVEVRKAEEDDIPFTVHSVIDTEKEVSCLRLENYLKTLFVGCKTGELFWYQYPFKLSPSESSKPNHHSAEPLGCLKLHTIPLYSIALTNNHKYLMVSTKSNGYFSLKVRKETGLFERNNNINFHQFGNPNLNKIQISSQEIQGMNKEKLKILLEKRKACFNDFQEFKKEWEVKKFMNSKNVQLSDKGQELIFINETLNNIDSLKSEKQEISTQIQNLTQRIEKLRQHYQHTYEKQAMSIYKKHNEQNFNLNNQKLEYENEFRKLLKDCQQNLIEIENCLEQKYFHFVEEYLKMKNNIEMYGERVKLENKMEEEERQLEKQLELENLKEKQNKLTQESNELSIKLTQAKKQNERYCNRRSFLQHKIRFFIEQNNNCEHEGECLKTLKLHFEEQLKELEHHTKKKQTKLKIFLKINDSLVKFKNIHENIIEDVNKEVAFINTQRRKIQKQIVDIQKELNQVADSNGKMTRILDDKSKTIYLKKNTLRQKKNNILNYQYWVRQISEELASIPQQMQQNLKIQKMKKIYIKYYMEKNVESILQKSKIIKKNPIKTPLNSTPTQHITRITQQLEEQKRYILKNFDLLNKCNRRIKEQINLNYLQIQTQNYNLIAECNVRKEEAIRKKKELHELIDSVKETQIYMNQMRKEKENDNTKKLSTTPSHTKEPKPIPFLIYQKIKDNAFDDHYQRVKTKNNPSITIKTKSENSHILVRKMLDINKMHLFGEEKSEQEEFRRIKTAGQKKQRFHLMKDSQGQRGEDDEGRIIVKPATATLKRRGIAHLRHSKNKSQSKPTTCTYSKGQSVGR